MSLTLSSSFSLPCSMICKIATAVIGLEMLAICRSDAANLRDLFPSNPDVGDIPRRSRPIDDPSSSNHKIKRRLGSLSVRDKATKENTNHSETASDSQSEVFHEAVISIREGLTWCGSSSLPTLAIVVSVRS